MAKTAGALLARRAELDGVVEALDREIAERTADGAEPGAVRSLRDRRRDAIDEASDIGDALLLLEERQHADDARSRGDAQREARRAAREGARAFVDSARAVDAALAALEDAHEEMRLRSLDLARDLRLAGLSDQGRLGRSLGPSLRWATWHSAPTYADDAEVPRAPVPRRGSMETLAARLVPQMPEG